MRMHLLTALEDLYGLERVKVVQGQARAIEEVGPSGESREGPGDDDD